MESCRKTKALYDTFVELCDATVAKSTVMQEHQDRCKD
jgi:hypothetical protein